MKLLARLTYLLNEGFSIFLIQVFQDGSGVLCHGEDTIAGNAMYEAGMVQPETFAGVSGEECALIMDLIAKIEAAGGIVRR